ncbi:hypothetical protein Mgra_00006745 [Meloidogyne graminicola]|uniref:Uncharacterized protein n=1 Tax=Meloidogyne graminicola TaxID=189291 RepID=A0A8S9ZKS9_9BILA|nr:hypothetical protein Mgra_00006745 [Meloidogyne graminicola]
MKSLYISIFILFFIIGQCYSRYGYFGGYHQQNNEYNNNQPISPLPPTPSNNYKIIIDN